MSLVNLAHVCSHLQNASLARLGLTSIPYTKWHLSLALLLQKQGFLSQVKLGGPSPPASCFGQGPRDNHRISNHPHGAAGRNPHSAESALARMVREGKGRYDLLSEGFGEEAIQFAEEHGRRSKAQLMAEGYSERAVQFILDTRADLEQFTAAYEAEFESRQQACNSQREREVVRAEYGQDVKERQQRATDEVFARMPLGQVMLYQKYSETPAEELSQVEFDLIDLEAIARKAAYISERQIRQQGITIEAMGLQIPNQSITLPEERFQDPDMMEAEGVVTQANRASRRLWLGMKYYESKPVLSKARMISKPTKRIMLNSQDIARLVRGSRAGEVKPLSQIGEIMAISTDKGIMEARECVERRIGGLAMCRVW